MTIAVKVLQDALAGAFDAASLVVRAEAPEQETELPVLMFGDATAELDPTLGDDARIWNTSIDVMVWSESRTAAFTALSSIMAALDNQAITPASGWSIDATDATLVESVSVTRADEGYWEGTVSVAAVLTED